MTNIDIELILHGSWNHEDPETKKENKRKMCSEVLVYPNVPVAKIKKIICPNKIMYDYAAKLKGEIGGSISDIIIEMNPNYYF